MASVCNDLSSLTDEYINKKNLAKCSSCKNDLQIFTVLKLFQINVATVETYALEKSLFESFYLMYYEAKKSMPSNELIKHEILTLMIYLFYELAFKNSPAHEQFTELVFENIKNAKQLYGEFCEEYLYAHIPLLDIMAFRKKNNMMQVKEGHQLISSILHLSSDEVINILDRFIKQHKISY